MSADVDQVARHRGGAPVDLFLNRLVAASDPGNNERGEQRVKQQPARDAAQVRACLHRHPDSESDQGRRPDPPKRIERTGVRSKNQEAGASEGHKRRRHDCPPLGLIGPTDRENREQRPAESPAEQRCSHDHVLLSSFERPQNERE